MIMMMIMEELIKAGSRLYHQYNDDEYSGVDQGWYLTYSLHGAESFLSS
jgi:hypothetical protein